VKQLCDALKRLRGVNNLAARLLDELQARRDHVSMMPKPPDNYTTIEYEFDLARL
jgi:hypothetical protein